MSADDLVSDTHVTVLDTLTPWEIEQVRFFQAYNVPAQWFVGVRSPDGVEVLAMGEDWIWSILLLEHEDRVATAETHMGKHWRTGIEV